MRPSSPLRQRFGYVHAMLLTLALSIAGLGTAVGAQLFAEPAPLHACTSVRVIDGDTFDCGGEKIRLQGIDAPETAGHCRPGRRCAPGDPDASTANLQRLVDRGAVGCRPISHDRYGRTIARCEAAGADLSCAQLEGDFAIRRYAYIWCGWRQAF